MLIVGIGMAFILFHERNRVRIIVTETDGMQEIQNQINTAYQNIFRLTTLSEDIIGWDETDRHHYHIQRLRTDMSCQVARNACCVRK